MYASSAGKNSRALTVFRGPYINLTFQDGPIQPHGENGTTNEEMIRLLIERIESLNTMEDGKFQSRFNDVAIAHLNAALTSLLERTRERQERGVEGTLVP